MAGRGEAATHMTFEQCILSAPWILECVVTKQRRASGWQRTRIGRELLGGRDWGATSVIALCRRHFLLVTQCSRPLGCFLTLPIWWSTRYGWYAGLDARRANRDGAEDEGRLPPMAGSVAPKFVKLNYLSPMVSDWREGPSRRPTAAKPDPRRGQQSATLS